MDDRHRLHLMRARVDDHREGNLDRLTVDEERERVLVHFEVARVDHNAARSDLIRRKLTDFHRRLEEIRHDDRRRGRCGVLQELMPLHQADVLKRVDALAAQTRNFELMAGCGAELEGNVEAGTG